MVPGGASSTAISPLTNLFKLMAKIPCLCHQKRAVCYSHGCSARSYTSLELRVPYCCNVLLLRACFSGIQQLLLFLPHLTNGAIVLALAVSKFLPLSLGSQILLPLTRGFQWSRHSTEADFFLFLFRIRMEIKMCSVFLLSAVAQQLILRLLAVCKV